MKKKIKSIIVATLSFALVLPVGATGVFAEEISEDAIAEEEIAGETTLSEEEIQALLDETVAVLENADGVCVNDEDVLEEEMDYTRYLFMGDSTVVGVGATTSFPAEFAKRRGCRYRNAAIGGAAYSTNQKDNNVVTQVADVNLSDYDVAFLLFGANDFAIAAPLGNTRSKDTSTVAGAMNNAIDKLQAANVDVYVITPFLYKGQLLSVPNTKDLYFSDYVKTIKNVAKAQGAHIIDFNTKLGVNAKNFDKLYIDPVHPGNELYVKAAEYLDSVMGARTDASEEGGASGFVKRLYTNCLDREPEKEGLEHWVGRLLSGEDTGSGVAYGVFFSDEYKKKGVSDEDYIYTLYTVMMDRRPSDEEVDYWLDALNNGVSRVGVFKGFAESTEFSKICGVYTIYRGDVNPEEARDRNVGRTAFVARLYTKALGRKYEVAGLNDWCERIEKGEWSIQDVSTTGFLHSQEFLNKHLSDEEFVEVLYNTFFDRESEANGKAYWVNKLKSGESRDSIVPGFANSEEFSNLKKKYGF